MTGSITQTLGWLILAGLAIWLIVSIVLGCLLGDWLDKTQRADTPITWMRDDLMQIREVDEIIEHSCDVIGWNRCPACRAERIEDEQDRRDGY